MNELSGLYKRQIAVTGGAGFIGSNLLLTMVPKYPDYLFVNIDCLTYAGNLSNLETIASLPNYRFDKVSICDYVSLEECFEKHQINSVIHLAAESHVDRSILGPAEFVKTNIIGTFNLLELSRKISDSDNSFRFHNVSTDEVFGSADSNQKFIEETPYRPNSPYAASKAAADHLVRSYHRTYGLDTVTSNCCNNYGPLQFPEKLVPLVINNVLNKKTIPVYGDGQQVRDWLHVADHCKALDLIFHNGSAGETYNVSGENETTNIELIKRICRLADDRVGTSGSESLIEFVTDRPGHDRRYAIDTSKIKKKLNWEPSHSLESGLKTTVDWYLKNKEWLKNCISGEYVKYYEKQYIGR